MPRRGACAIRRETAESLSAGFTLADSARRLHARGERIARLAARARLRVSSGACPKRQAICVAGCASTSSAAGDAAMKLDLIERVMKAPMLNYERVVLEA